MAYSFDGFRLDTQRRLLRRGQNGPIVKLTPKVFELLVYLVEHRGTVVGKQELLEAIWPNVIVEENTLTQAVSTLRKALGENPQDHRYVATVPGRGYRFVGDVTQSPNELQADALEGVVDSTENAAAETSRASVRPLYLATLAVLMAAAAVIAAVLVMSRIEPPPDASGKQTIFQITGSEPVHIGRGSNSQPTFSPDGKRAAFVNDMSGTPQVYVQNLGSGAPHQITEVPSGAGSPSWSPLDDRIVYGSASGGIWSVDPMGTLKPRMIEANGAAPSFSWDGRSVVYESGAEIVVSAVDGSGQRAVSGVSPGNRLFAPAYPQLSPAGDQIVYFQQAVGPLGDYWIIPSSGGEPRQLTHDLHWGGRAAWTPDGSHVIFPSKRGGTLTLWSIPAAGGVPAPITTGLGQDRDPVVSRDGARLLYTTTHVEYFFIITNPDTGESEVLFKNRRSMSFPRVSPDGETLVFFSESQPREQVMLINSDGTGLEQLTQYRSDEANIMPRWSPDGTAIYYYQNMPPAALRRLPVAGGPNEIAYPEFDWQHNTDAEWSPSEDRVAFVRVDRRSGERRVVVRTKGGEQTLMDPALQYAPSWSGDGRQLLGTAQHQVLLCPVNGAACTLLFDGRREQSPSQTGALGHYAQWSWDRTRIFFTRRTDSRYTLSLWVMKRDGSEPRRLFEYGPVQPLDGRFQVLPGDRILWVRYDQSRAELVLARLNRTGN